MAKIALPNKPALHSENPRMGQTLTAVETHLSDHKTLLDDLVKRVEALEKAKP